MKSIIAKSIDKPPPINYFCFICTVINIVQIALIINQTCGIHIT